MADGTDIFFGLQVAITAPPGDSWRTRLAVLLRQHTRDATRSDQRGFYSSLANLLLEASDRVRFGYWDFVPGGRAEYDEWVRGIEDDTTEPWVPDATGARMDLVLVSALFLLPAAGPCAEIVGDRCDLPESAWHTRTSYRHLFETLTQLNFASVRGDAVYLTPGGDTAAFSRRELEGDGYDYLHAVR